MAVTFRSGGLTITTNGRSLARAGAGDTVRVMNLASRKIIAGIVSTHGSVRVGQTFGDGNG